MSERLPAQMMSIVEEKSSTSGEKKEKLTMDEAVELDKYADEMRYIVGAKLEEIGWLRDEIRRSTTSCDSLIRQIRLADLVCLLQFLSLFFAFDVL